MTWAALHAEIAETFLGLERPDLRRLEVYHHGWTKTPKDVADAFIEADYVQRKRLRQRARQKAYWAARRAAKVRLGRRRPGPHLTRRHYAMIRALRDRGFSQYAIAQQLGTTRNTVYRILTGRFHRCM